MNCTGLKVLEFWGVNIRHRIIQIPKSETKTCSSTRTSLAWLREVILLYLIPSNSLVCLPYNILFKQKADLSNVNGFPGLIHNVVPIPISDAEK